MAWKARTPRRRATIPSLVKFVGNVPAKPPAGGTLRHKGWRATKVDLPALPVETGRYRHRTRGNRN